MSKEQQVTGPVEPGQYGAMQVSDPSACYPTQTSDPTAGMFSAMMPMLKGITGSSTP